MSKRTTTSEFGRTIDVRVNRIHPNCDRGVRTRCPGKPPEHISITALDVMELQLSKSKASKDDRQRIKSYCLQKQNSSRFYFDEVWIVATLRKLKKKHCDMMVFRKILPKKDIKSA